MERREFIVDTAAQRLYFDSPWGRPTATPTVETATAGGTVTYDAANTNVTLIAVDTTINVSADAGATSVSVASATNIAVGDVYWLTNKYGQTEQARVEKTNSTTIHFVDPLMYAYDLVASSSYGDFESAEFYYTLQADDYDDLDELRVAKAAFTAGGQPRIIRQTFDIVNVPLEAPGPLTADAVYERLGRDLARQEPDEQRGEDFAPQRYAAWNIVRKRLYQHSDDSAQWRPSMVVEPSDLFEYAIAVFTRVCHEQGIEVLRTSPTREELLAGEENERAIGFKAISWLDKDEDETKADTEHELIEMDFVR